MTENEMRDMDAALVIPDPRDRDKSWFIDALRKAGMLSSRKPILKGLEEQCRVTHSHEPEATLDEHLDVKLHLASVYGKTVR